MTVIWEPALDEEAKRWRTTADRLTREHFVSLAAELDREQRYPWENVRRFVEHAKAWAHFDVYAWTQTTKSRRPEGGDCQAARALYALLTAGYSG